MRPLPLNLRDTYGHVRMAVYSAGLDVEIRSADHLPNGMMGCYSERTRTNTHRPSSPIRGQTMHPRA